MLQNRLIKQNGAKAGAQEAGRSYEGGTSLVRAPLQEYIRTTRIAVETTGSQRHAGQLAGDLRVLPEN